MAPQFCVQLELGSSKLDAYTTVEPRYNDMPREQWNQIVISRYRYIETPDIDYFPIPHNTLCLPPKFCITYCLKMLLGKCNTPRSI